MKKFLLLLLLLLSSCATGLSLTSCALFTSLALTSLSLTSCSHTRYIPLPESHQRDSLSKSVNILVNTTRMERFHIERLLPTDTINSSPYAGGRGVLIFDSIYVEKFTDVEVHDTVVVTQRDTITIPVPVEPPIDHSPRRKSPALSSKAAFWGRGAMKWWGRGILIGGIGAILLAILAYIANRFYHHR